MKNKSIIQCTHDGGKGILNKENQKLCRHDTQGQHKNLIRGMRKDERKVFGNYDRDLKSSAFMAETLQKYQR